MADEAMHGGGELILYQAPDGAPAIRLRVSEGTVWLSQAEIAELFGTTPQNVTQHLRTIYSEGELIEGATCKEHLQVRAEGGREVRRALKIYSLDAILAIGYRVRSPRGTQFRQWATANLKEYLVKGFLMDDARLKDPIAWDYFDELLQRIRDIRASEKRFYQKVRELYATAMDYDPHSEQAKLFFAKVQNKMLWAVTGQTAAELIADRSDANQPNMGLRAWSGSRVRKQDVATAKNYLRQEEITDLDRVVVMYLDYAEDQARRRKTMTMAEWAERLDGFLTFNERELLTHSGRVSAQVAESLAHRRYEEFDAHRRQQELTEADAEDQRAIEELRHRLPPPMPDQGPT